MSAMIHGRNGTAEADASSEGGNRSDASWDEEGLEHHSDVERYAEAVVICVFIAVAVVSNVSLCAAILRKSSLRQMRNMLFIVNLCVADLLASVIVMPITTLTVIRARWIYSEQTCKVMGYLSTQILVSSIMLLGVMSVNRYIKICKPNIYSHVYTSLNTFLMNLGVWILSAVISSPPLLGWGMYSYLPRQSICLCDWSTSWSYTFFMISVCFGCPLVMVAVCNACVLRTFVKSQRCLQQHARAAEEQRKARIESAKTNERSARKDMKPLKTIPSISKTAAQSVAKVTPAEPITTSAEEPKWFPSAPDGEQAEEERDPVVRDPTTAFTSSTYTTDSSTQSVVTVSCVTPTAQQKANREQKKAQHYSEQFRLSVSVMVVIAVFVLCWFPFCISMLLSLFAPHWLSHATDMTFLLLGFSSNCFNPIIYGLMNRRVRDAYIKMWIKVRRALL